MLVPRPFALLLCIPSLRWQLLASAAKSGVVPGYYDELHLHDHDSMRPNTIEHVGRVGNVDVIRTTTAAANNGTTVTEIGLCHIVGLLAFSGRSGGELVANVGQETYMHLSSILLAVHHFNTGDGSVVADAEGINERCNVRFTTEFHDTQSDMYVTLKTLTDVITRDEDDHMTDHRFIAPGAIIGASRSESTGTAATLSGVHGLAQMSFTSSGTSLNDPFHYPLFSRVIPSDEASATVAVQYLTEHNDVRHVAVIFVNDKYGNDYNKDFHRRALSVDPPVDVQSFTLQADPTDSAIKAVVALVKKTGYRHVFAIVFQQHYERLMTEAAAQGIAGPGYSWLFTTGALQAFLDGRSYDAGSPLAIATQGVGILVELGGYSGSHGYNNFVEAWRGISKEEVEYINSKVPGGDGDDDYLNFFKASGPEFFRITDPAIAAPFAYDTVMALGLGACNATNGDRYFTGKEHHRAIKDFQFSGASGRVRIDNATSSRVPTSTFYALFNVVAVDSDSSGDGHGVVGRSFNDSASTNFVTFSVRESILFKPQDKGEDWNVVEKTPFVFAGGGFTPPPGLPPLVVNMHYIGRLRYFGYVLCAIVLLLSAGFAIWTCANREVRVVRASQPPFLIMICSGTFIMGSAIIAMGIDDEYNTDHGCSVACMAVPWLTTIGFVTSFSALFSKLWRINKIFNNPSRFRRIKVTEADVIVPFVGLMTANLVVLICWTVLAPLEHDRIDHVGTDQFNRVLSTYAVCTTKTGRRGGAVPYLVLLVAINFATVVIANIQAYRARNVKSEFSESKYIAIIMASLLQSWILGIPLLVLVYDIPEANYIVKTALIFVTTMAILLFMFIPKIRFVKQWKLVRARKLAKILARKHRQSRRNTLPAEFSPDRERRQKPRGASGLRLAVVESFRNYDDDDVGGEGVVERFHDRGSDDARGDCVVERSRYYGADDVNGKCRSLVP